MSHLSTNVTAPLPTLYEYYTSNGIKSGFNADRSYFTLNEKNITLYSGAMHYFRTPKKLWRNRLRKMRAAGLNAVETYVPWNLHEPRPGEFDFGNGGSDMQDFLDIETFLKIVQEEDLLAILRPGPYICAEWEFGGFPSWLLRERDIKFRTSDTKYFSAVKRFFNALLPILAALQFINGGPIIGFQVENEYGSTVTSSFRPDKKYLRQLRQIYLDNNITELLMTADGVTVFRDAGTLPQYFLVTANFNGNPVSSFNALEQIQPGRPKMAMEYYPGWFDHWGETHHTTSEMQLMLNLYSIIAYPGSFNIYMFHGGTSFGFLNGANLNNQLTDNSAYQPDITSYDYAAPLTEAGDYTKKYDLIKTLLQSYASPKTRLPEKPQKTLRIAYPNVSIVEHISIKSLLDSQQIKLEYATTIPMELLDINNGTGQSFGYITYRKEHLNLPANAILNISGHIRDTVMVFVNGKLISLPLRTSDDLDHFGFWRLNNSQLILTETALWDATLDLVVENWGRVGYGKLPQYYQFKGLWQTDILINNKAVILWQHIPLEFKKVWTNNLRGWQKVRQSTGPGLYKGYFYVDTAPYDTYIDMRLWTKGIVTINGFVLGRYATIGPQQCLYLPAPLINRGYNEIVIFEHYEASDTIAYSHEMCWETK
ncbi:beta-galactosidase-1-like protein 3 [Anthonomus grandis grandis]|uniref:beta-galactosidase-1-like protein 3 n=1 Tax=Anthonomus grandis grandis TaxID=2921223 RepID=UPI0021650761|nr:beta-galactosidase-1-like protein 3 [Anthonomus grandis grandis]XP_050294012.1 beta-galactosidase-1-like protein 3 [Anthonomus grandis grandis]